MNTPLELRKIPLAVRENMDVNCYEWKRFRPCSDSLLAVLECRVGQEMHLFSYVSRRRRLAGVAVVALHIAATTGAAGAEDIMGTADNSAPGEARPEPTVVVATVTVDAVTSSAAQTTQANVGGDTLSIGSLRVDAIVDSARGNSGVLFVNAAAGNQNNQGSSASFAVSREASAAYTTASSTIDQYLVANGVAGRDQTQQAGIFGSLSDNSGTVGVNQAAGDGNNQANALAMALGFSPGGGLILSEADLQQVSASNTIAEVNVSRTAAISNSGNRSNGIMSVNQASGNLISQANLVVFAASGSFRKP